MKNIEYIVRIEGLDEPSGTIAVEAMRDLCDALIDAARRSLRLALEGRSTSKGPAPAWLRRSADLTIRGIGKGSTTLDVTAPTLGSSIPDEVAQIDIWEQRPTADDTALSTLIRAFTDASAGGTRVDSLDGGVLAGMLKFDNLIAGNGVSVSIGAVGRPLEYYEIDRSSIETVRMLRQSTPSPRVALISGDCSTIEYPEGRFRLLLPSGERIAGRVDTDAIDVESLRSLWGRAVTVKGTILFSPSGRSRFIEADLIRLQEPGEELLATTEQFLEVNPGGQRERALDASTALKSLWGAWPGDEPIEELLRELREGDA